MLLCGSSVRDSVRDFRASRDEAPSSGPAAVRKQRPLCDRRDPSPARLGRAGDYTRARYKPPRHVKLVSLPRTAPRSEDIRRGSTPRSSDSKVRITEFEAVSANLPRCQRLNPRQLLRSPQQLRDGDREFAGMMTAGPPGARGRLAEMPASRIPSCSIGRLGSGFGGRTRSGIAD
jgi:hypothetical protein